MQNFPIIDSLKELFGKIVWGLKGINSLFTFLFKRSIFKRSGSFIFAFVAIFSLSISTLIGYVFPNEPFGDMKEHKTIVVNASSGNLKIRYPFVKANFIFSEFRGSIIIFDDEFVYVGYCKLSDGGKKTYHVPVIAEYKKPFNREKKKFYLRFHSTFFEWEDFSSDEVEFKVYPGKNKAYIQIKAETKGKDTFRIHWGETFLADGKIELYTK